MNGFVKLVGPNDALEIGGVKLVGATTENAKKFLFSVVLILVLLLLNRGLRWLVWLLLGKRRHERPLFWMSQAIRLFIAAAMILGVVSIWFDNPTRLTTFLGLVSAGLAFALQKVITALAGYFVILRGQTFNVGDRITMGGVRGDVIALGFFQTTIMEMGQPPAVQDADPAMWIQARQYTGRIVTVTNAKIFDEPVYNYTREFPCIWEEMHLPISYNADYHRAEQILLDVVQRHTVKINNVGEEILREVERRYAMKRIELGPRVYYRLTDNWIELSVRFLTLDHNIREVKDAISRDLLAALQAAGIGIASSTFEIVGLPPVRFQGLPPLADNGHQVRDGQHA